MSVKEIRERHKKFMRIINDPFYVYNHRDLFQLHQDRTELLDLLNEARVILKGHFDEEGNTPDINYFLNKLY